jgi:hypothetical protein
MGKSPDEAKERHWRGLLREREHSGKSVAQFCRQRRIPVHQYYWWQRQLRMRDAVMQSHADNGEFVPVRVPVNWPTMEVVHPGGCVIRISAGIDPQSLRSVLEALPAAEEA